MPVEGINGILNVENAALHASQVGIANTNPQHILSVGSNLFVSGDSSDVLTVDGNVVCEGVKVGLIEITPSYDFEAVTTVGNVTSNTLQFTNPTTGFVATGNVEVGTANLFVDTTVGRVGVGTLDPEATLHVDGDAIVTGNLTVSGTTTIVDTQHLRVTDPLIELGKDNVTEIATDLGIVMTRPAGSSNVAIVYDESATSLNIGYTLGNASQAEISMESGTPLDVNIYGNVHVSSNLTVNGNILYTKPTSILVDSNVVAEYTGPHGRGAAVLNKYPEIIFEEGKFDANDSTNTYVQAGYTVTASSVLGSVYTPWRIFDDYLSGNDGWATLNRYNASSPGEAQPGLGAIEFPAASGRYGEYIDLQLPHGIKVNNFIIKTRPTQSGSGTWMPEDSPGAGYLYGSINGTDWTEIKAFSGLTYGGMTTNGGTQETVQVDSTVAYKYLRLQATHRAGQNASDRFIAIGALEYYGYEELATQGDTSIDTTLKSVMNTPQTTGANVYVDGNLGATFTNQVTGPTPVGTSAPHDTTGKYWELTGELTSNITVEANTFLEGDQPHAVSVWFNSSNLETNTSNSCIFSIGTEERLDHQGIEYQLLNRDYKTEHKILASNAGADDEFGYHVALSADGNYAIVGAPFEDTGYSKAGSAYIYVKSGTGWSQQAQLTASNAGADDEFGKCVALSADGTYAIVGAHKEDTTASGAGSAYIFIRSGTGWSQQAQLTASNAGASDMFGHSVSINGNGTYAVVGAKYEDTGATNAGAAYVFFRNGGTSWSQQAQLGRSSPASYEYFGESVAISSDGSYIVVGVPYYAIDYDQGGTAVIFIRSGTSWSQQAILPVPAYDGTNNYQQAHVGMSVDISDDGTYAVIGGPDAKPPGMYDNYGVAIVFIRSGTSWSLQTVLTANPNFSSYSYFGYSVAINGDGDYIMVGQYESNPGKGFIFSRSVTSWSQKEIISPSDNENGEWMGYSVDIADDATVMLGAPRRPTSDRTGAAYIVHRDTFGYAGSEPKLKLQANTWHNLTYAYQGEGGSKVTYLDGRKVAEDQAEDTFGEYPPFAMTGYSQGGYVVSASSEFDSSNYPGWYAFDADPELGWLCEDNAYTGSTYNGSRTLGTGTVNGEYIILEMPHGLRISYVNIKHRNANTDRSPASGRFYGSNDGITWEEMKQFSGITTADYAAGTIDIVINSNKYYKRVALVVTGIPKTSVDWLGIGNLRYYGHRENDLVRLPDPTNVLKYPHVALTGPAQRGYVASASSFYNSGVKPEHGFNGVLTSSGLDHVWESGPSGNNTTGGGGRYTAGSTFNTAYLSNTPLFGEGGFQTTEGSSNTWTGEWLQIQLPHSINTTKYVFGNAVGNSTWNERIPTSGVILGSTNGSTWNLVHQFSSTLIDQTLTISHTGYYKYFRLVGTTVGGGETIILIPEWELYGTEEGSVPIQIGGGNIDKVANFRVYDKFVGEDQALEIWDAQKDYFGRAKSSMTLYKGRLGLGTTEPEGRLAVLDEPSGLEEFPPRAMTTEETYMEGHGVFKASSEWSRNSNYKPFAAFNKYTHDINATVSQDRMFWSSINAFTGNPGVFNGDSSKNIGGYTGVGLKLEMPYSILCNRIDLYPRNPYGTPSYSQNPRAFKFIASKDNEFWDLLHEETSFVDTGGHAHPFHINTTQYYKYFAIVVTGVAGNTTLVSFVDLQFFGTREQGQSVLHDGQLTLTKNLNVPRIGPAPDADDTPRRDRLVVEYNTSTNPTFEGAVRDTSGRGNDGFMVGTAAYDATQKAFTFSGDDGDAHITRSQIGNSAGAWVHSFSTWVNTNDITYNHIFSIGVDSDNDTSTFRYDAGQGANAFKWFFYGNDISFTYSGNSLNTWLHIVGVYDGGAVAGSRRLWVNGVESVQSSSSGIEALTLPANTQLTLGDRSNRAGDQSLNGEISQFKLYDCTLTAEEVKTLYDMGRCDEGHHVVNFSKTRVGIGLGDGEAPQAALDVRGGVNLHSLLAGATGGSETEITDQNISYKVHSFTTTGTSQIIVHKGGLFECLVVAGGGAGGYANAAGGGAGGVVIQTVFVHAGTYNVVVGAGNTSGTRNPGQGSSGSYSQYPTGKRGVNSTVFNLLAIGGGNGAGDDYSGADGGSGGGCADYNDTIPGRGVQNQEGSNGYGNRGGFTRVDNSGGAGGGGAGEVGFDIDPDLDGGAANATWTLLGRDGGNGVGSTIRTGSTQYYGGGGGGARRNSGAVPVAGVGGKGGGGNGADTNGTGSAGSANTGGGGGGSSGNSEGGDGGSGIVVVRYRI